MQSKVVSYCSLFRTITPSQLREIKTSERILEVFVTETPTSKTLRKIVLTESYLVLFQQKESEHYPSLLLDLNDSLRFQRIYKITEEESKTAALHGFSLISSQGKSVKLFLQHSSLAEIWINYLSKVLIELGFHQQYEILSKIGNGSSATVCSVRRLRDGNIFAAKIFPKSCFLNKPQKKASVYNEIQLLRATDHPNIIKIVSVLQSQTAIYMITDQLNGGNLFQRININRGLTLEQTKKVMVGILNGLAYMHKFGMMHRDIKLQNVMLKAADSWEPVLVDFGLAAISDDQPYIYYRCGTPGYIAPEIITLQGKEQISVECDIFSAGIILHVLLTNSFLFNGKNNQQTYSSNKALNFNLTEEKYKSVDAKAMELLKLMLELDPSERIGAQQCLEHQFLQCKEQEKQKDTFSPTSTDVEYQKQHFHF